MKWKEFEKEKRIEKKIKEKREKNKDWAWKEYMSKLVKLTINDIHFVYSSELAPIEFTENPESII